MIEYLTRHNDNKGFTSLIQRNAITEYYILNGENKTSTTSFLATLSITSCFKEAPEKLENQWRSCIEYVANLKDTKHIELEDFLCYFLENGRMKNVCNLNPDNMLTLLSPTKIGAARIAPWQQPVWGHLEVPLAEWIKEMHQQRMSRLSCSYGSDCIEHPRNHLLKMDMTEWDTQLANLSRELHSTRKLSPMQIRHRNGFLASNDQQYIPPQHHPELVGRGRCAQPWQADDASVCHAKMAIMEAQLSSLSFEASRIPSPDCSPLVSPRRLKLPRSASPLQDSSRVMTEELKQMNIQLMAQLAAANQLVVAALSVMDCRGRDPTRAVSFAAG
jgi:hypothetical protein